MIDHISLPRFTGTRQAHDHVIRTSCGECTQGCGLLAYILNGRIVDVQGDESHPISRGRLCAKGFAFLKDLNHPERLRRLGYRTHFEESFQNIEDWDIALDQLGERLKRIRERHEPESLVIGCDPEAGLDFYMGAIRFARIWGTPHVYHPLEEKEDPLWPQVLNTPARPCPEWVHSRCLFLIEADLASTHPVAFQWVLEARKRGATIIAADARFTATMAKADRTLRIAPASGNDLGLALVKYLMESGTVTLEGMKSLLENAESWKASLDRLFVADLEQVTLASGEEIETLCRIITDSGPVTLITGKRLAFRPNYHIWLTLSALLGWTPSGAGGWHPLESGLPPLDPGSDISAPDNIDRTRAGDFSHQFARESESDLLHPVKAVITTGNCLDEFLAPYQALMKHVELAAHFGSFPNVTWSWSHMVFPAALWPERKGLVFSQDRAVSWCEALVDPLPDCRPGLDLWIGLAKRMGWEEHFPWTGKNGRADYRAFNSWLLEQSPLLKGGDLNRIEEAARKSEPLFWPFTEDGGVTRNIVPPPDGKLRPASVCLTAGPEKSSLESFPLFFQATRLFSHSGEAGRWHPGTSDQDAGAVVQLHPDTAEVLGVENGDEVVVRGPRNSMIGRAWLNRMAPRWLAWSPQRLGDKVVMVHKTGADPVEALYNLRRFLK